MSDGSMLFLIDVRWLPAEGDEPAGYLAVNDELGLVVEADSADDLRHRVRQVLPALFALNVPPDRREGVRPTFAVANALPR